MDNRALSSLVQAIQPKEAMRSKHGRVLDLVERALQQGSLSVSKYIKAGSFGKGTMIDLQAHEPESKEKSDIDLVLIMANVSAMQHVHQLKAQLELLKAILESAEPPLKELRFHKFTPYAVRFSVEDVRVDLLPAFKLEQSTRIEDMNQRLWPYATKCMAEAQIEFVKGRDSWMKDWIRLVKFWKSRFHWPIGSKPSSYFLELLTIHLVEKDSKMRDNGPGAFVKAFIGCLKEVEKLDVHFGLTSRIPPSVRRTPLLCDPANPTNNVAAFLHCANVMDVIKLAASHGQDAFSKKYKSIDLDAKRIETARMESNALMQVAALQSRVTQLEESAKPVNEKLQRVEPLVQQLQTRSLEAIQRWKIDNWSTKKKSSPAPEIASKTFNIAGRTFEVHVWPRGDPNQKQQGYHLGNDRTTFWLGSHTAATVWYRLTLVHPDGLAERDAEASNSSVTFDHGVIEFPSPTPEKKIQWRQCAKATYWVDRFVSKVDTLTLLVELKLVEDV